MKETPIDYQSPSVWSSTQDLPMWSTPDKKGERTTTRQELVDDLVANSENQQEMKYLFSLL